MAQQRIGIIVNGATGRMGYRQHLVRSLLAIRDAGGVPLSSGDHLMPELILVGRNEERIREIAERHNIAEYSTDLDAALADPRWDVYFDAVSTTKRHENLLKAIDAGRTIYTEKPTAETLADALDLARRARAAGVRSGVVHDKLFLPGLLQLRRLIDSGFFGRILSVRGEFGYWVFEGDWRSAQRPSWNYRSEDGGGIVADMFPHWNYVFENLFGRVASVYAHVTTHIPERWDEAGARYAATADDAAYAIFELDSGVLVQMNSSWEVRVNRDELVEFQVDGTLGSAVVGLHGCRVQPRVLTPLSVWNPDLPDPVDHRAHWQEVPQDQAPVNGFRAQWEEFLRAVAEDTEYPFDLLAGARGVQLAEAGLESSREGRRVTLSRLEV